MVGSSIEEQGNKTGLGSLLHFAWAFLAALLSLAVLGFENIFITNLCLFSIFLSFSGQMTEALLQTNQE